MSTNPTYDFITSADHTFSLRASTHTSPLANSTYYQLQMWQVSGGPTDYAQQNGTEPAMTIPYQLDLATSNFTYHEFMVQYYARSPTWSNTTQLNINVFVAPVITLQSAAGTPSTFWLHQGDSPSTLRLSGRILPTHAPVTMVILENGRLIDSKWFYVNETTGNFNFNWTFDPNNMNQGKYNYTFFVNTTTSRSLPTNDSMVYPPVTDAMTASRSQSLNYTVLVYGATSTNTNVTQHAFLSINTDQQSYEQGQAVTLNGTVTIDDTPHEPNRNFVLVKTLIPGYSVVALKVPTDGNGHFSIMPFAGYTIGQYTFIAQAQVQLDNGTNVTATDTASFNVTPATPVLDMNPQLQQIVPRYNSDVPVGPIRTEPAYDPILNTWPVGKYGDFENVEIAGTLADPHSDFTCGGYQKQVLQFFNDLRFNPDANVRALLNGLDYGPVKRGYGIFGGHHAVVLFPMGTDWNSVPTHVTQYARIFDPWPRQEPMVEFVSDFVAGWGFPGPDGGANYYASSPDNPFLGYPITGAPVYTNWGPNGLGESKNIKNSTTADATNNSAGGVLFSGLPTPDYSVGVGSPVGALIVNSKGQELGMLPDGTLVQQFPAYVDQYLDANNKTDGWYFGLFNNDTYTLTLTGLAANSTFGLLMSSTASPGYVFNYGEQTIGMGQTANVSIDQSMDNVDSSQYAPQLFMPNGTVLSPVVNDSYAAAIATSSGTSSATPSGTNSSPISIWEVVVAAIFIGLVVKVLHRKGTPVKTIPKG